MAGPTLYCTLADVLALVSLDQQARLATDQGAVPLAAKGDGTTLTFDTPFTGATSIKVFIATPVDPGLIIDATMSPGTGLEGVDQVVFTTAPADGASITAQANIGAVNINVVNQCRVLATNEVKRYLPRYGTEDLPADVLAILTNPTVFYVRWFLRERRGMNEYSPLIEQKKSVDAWLMGVATGKIALPASAPIAQPPPPTTSPVIAEPSVFEPPYGGTNGGGYLW